MFSFRVALLGMIAAVILTATVLPVQANGLTAAERMNYLEGKINKLEAGQEQVSKDIAGFKKDFEEFKKETKAKLDSLGSKFNWLLAAIIALLILWLISFVMLMRLRSRFALLLGKKG